MSKWNKKFPTVLLVVILGILAVFVFDLEEYGVKIVGEIPKGLPAFQIPNFNFQDAMDLWPIALTLALVGYLEAISIGKAIEERKHKLMNENNECENAKQHSNTQVMKKTKSY